MRNYELTLVLDGKAAAGKKKTQELIEKIVTTLKGKVVKFEDWGVKDLASSIGKSTSGIFLHFKLELDSISAKQLTVKLRSEEAVLRHLLIRV